MAFCDQSAHRKTRIRGSPPPSGHEIYVFILESEHSRIKHQRIFDNTYKSKAAVILENLCDLFKAVVTDPSIPKHSKKITITKTLSFLEELKEKGFLESTKRRDLPYQVRYHEKTNSPENKLTIPFEHDNIVNIPTEFTYHQEGYSLTAEGKKALLFTPLSFRKSTIEP